MEFRNFIQEERQKSNSVLLPTEDLLKIFSNLPELLMLNSELLGDFENRVQNWSKTKKIRDIIVSKGPYLKLYTAYAKNFSAMSSHFEECCKKYPTFGKLVKEFEKFPQCRNLKLSHYLLKPVQRLPQYKMLLEDYLKHLDAASEDYDDTTTALRIVTEAAEHANETVKQMVGSSNNYIFLLCYQFRISLRRC
jgi:FYVE/RhoGEF/PH domain-containing protein 5/6